MVIREGIGARLREERDRLGYTQADFGELAGVKRNTQAAYENEANSATTAYLHAIDRVGADVWYVLTGQPVPETSLISKEEELLRLFRLLVHDDRKMIERIISALHHRPPSGEHDTPVKAANSAS